MISGRRAYPRWLVRGLAVFALGMTVFAAVASREHHSSETARDVALSELVAFEAGTVRQSDPALATQLALTAYRLSQTTAARSALIEASAVKRHPGLIGGPGQTALALSADGRLAATGDGAGQVTLWGVTAAAHPQRLARLRAGSGAVRALSFGPRGASLAAADINGRVQRWSLTDPSRPVPAAPLTVPGAGLLDAVSFSPDGSSLAGAGGDHRVRLWDLSHPAGPQLLAQLSGFSDAVTALVFSGSGQTLFAGSADHTVRIWSVAKPTSPLELPSSPLTGPSSQITRLALSPDGGTLAVATIDGRVWLWAIGNPANASLSASLSAAHGRITTLAFNPSDDTLVAGGDKRSVTVWDYWPYQAADRVCALERTAITVNEWKLWVPGVAYNPPCAKWKPPAPPRSPS